MYEKGEEPCLIGMYRKEQAGELNSHRQIRPQKGKPFIREEKRSLLEPRVRGFVDVSVAVLAY